MRQRREKNSELRLRKRLVEDAEAEEERGIFELFHRDEQPDEDAPLSRAQDDEQE